MLEPLQAYQPRFWARFYKDAKPWARDNIIWDAVMAVLPPIAVWLHGHHARFDWPVVRITLYLYGFAFLVYVVVHICRVPRKLDEDRDARESSLTTIIGQRDETIRFLSEKPKRSPAQQDDYETVKRALDLLKEKGHVALRHIRRHGSLTFGTFSPALPPGLGLDDTLWVFNHCVSEGVLTCKSDRLNGERTYSVSARMESALDELLFANEVTPR